MMRVCEFVKEICKIDLTTDELDALVEGIVNEIKNAS